MAQIEKIVGSGACVADLMCGTAAVSTSLRQRGYRVIANDVMTYAYHHARVALLFTNPPTFERASKFVDTFYPNEPDGLFPRSPYERMIAALNSVSAEEGYFWREFCVEGCPTDTDKSRNYFSPANARKIDGIRTLLRRLSETNQIDDLERSLLLHDLIMAVNDVANIAGTYGHYMAKLRGRAKTPIRLTATPLLTLPDEERHIVLRDYAEDVARKITCDLCYIDPPYMKRQYEANYHILETIAREDEPEAIGVSGLRPWRDQYSNFCTKTRIRASFRKVLSEMQCTHFLVSYSEDGLLGVDELESLFSEFGRVRTYRFAHKRFRSNSSKLSSKVTEYLIHVEKRRS